MAFETVIVYHKIGENRFEEKSEKLLTEKELRTEFAYTNVYIFPLNNFNPGMVWEELQNDFGQNYNATGEPIRSLSVGDLIICVNTSKIWEVARLGFAPLEMSLHHE